MRRLRQLRSAKGFSQTKLSKKSGVSQSFIHDLETGQKQPTIKTIHKLARALGIPVSELIEEDEDQSA